MSKQAQAAAEAIGASIAAALVTTGGGPGAELPETVFPRLSLERRVLGFVTDDIDFTPLGPRNTLAALTYSLMRDPGTTNPPTDEHGRLEVDGKEVAQVAQLVLEVLERLREAGLIGQRANGSYRVTKAGIKELGS